ncbi:MULTISPECIES: hypothetical protein [Yersinia]|uniref:hypothetical protein n=1 Tax=Yersinia TaxID=629 RepID=UPI0005E6CF3D|nr:MULTISPECIES: hypothetical protein [Yersinia]UNK25140.1 hypothetical protein MNQ97_09325 [Yersinia intermedia]CNJ15126.1 Uncharacterised protein [Yersinia aldovae]
MAETAPENKLKNLRIGFFTSSDGTKKNTSNAKPAFESLFTVCIASGKNSHTAEFEGKKLKIQIIDKDNDAGFYFGYLSCSRDGFHLPYIGDEHWEESSIPLGDTKYIVERTYFIYYFEQDILLLSLNHLGPKVKDLSFLLYNSSPTLAPVAFEAIWKEESIKQLLETGTTLRSCDLTLAAPRNFNVSNYDLSSSLSKNIIEMMAGMGGSHLRLSLRGRASGKKGIIGYLSNEVKEGLKELLEKLPEGIIKKAEVTEPRNSKPESLLDQVLISKRTALAVNGYPVDSHVRVAMIQAKIEFSGYLDQYSIKGK